MTLSQIRYAGVPEWRGVFSTGVSYVPGDVVYQASLGYPVICTTATSGAYNAAHWQQWAAKGADGATGPQGSKPTWTTSTITSPLTISEESYRFGMVPSGGLTVNVSNPSDTTRAWTAWLVLRQPGTPATVTLDVQQPIPVEFVPYTVPHALQALELMWTGDRWLIVSGIGCQRIRHAQLGNCDYGVIIDADTDVSAVNLTNLRNAFNNLAGLASAGFRTTLKGLRFHFEVTGGADLSNLPATRPTSSLNSATVAWVPGREAAVCKVAALESGVNVYTEAAGRAADTLLWASAPRTCTVNGVSATITQMSAHTGFVNRYNALSSELKATYTSAAQWFGAVFAGCYQSSAVLSTACGGDSTLITNVKADVAALTGESVP